LLIIRVKPDGSGIRVWVEDNGAGFPDDFNICDLKSIKGSKHSHIALRNLNQRLLWIGGANNSLSISSEEYINRMRIEKARELLALTDMLVYEVAEAVGFKDSAYFSLVFKKITGVSPKDFKTG